MKALLSRILRREPSAKPQPKFLSWYRSPILLRLNWLAKEKTGEGFWYSQNKADAFRFDSEAEARQRTPSYDGSDGIEKRTGLIKVYE